MMAASKPKPYIRIDNQSFGRQPINNTSQNMWNHRNPKMNTKNFLPENMNLRIATSNVGGIMTNVSYVEQLLVNIDILFVQEHWLYPESLSFLDSIHRHFSGWGRSCSDLNMNSVWRRGKGGVAFL